MSARNTQEQQAADEYHHEKCKSTKFICGGSVCLFLFIVFLITSVGLWNANDLAEYNNAQYKENCYINIAHNAQCNTQTCTDSNACSQNTYTIKLDDDSTCAVDECVLWDNGCVALSFTAECTKQHEFEAGDIVPCYAYGDTDGLCKDVGKLDPDDKWSGQFTTFVVLLVFAIIFVIISLVLFVFGFVRCLCKKIEDEVLGETKGTGCYWCGDYDRCCYGEGHGHATVVNPQEKNLPIKDKKRKGKNEGGGGRAKITKHDSYDEEEQELR